MNGPYMFGVSHRRVTRKQARALEGIAREHECSFVEVWGREYQGGYQSWFSGPNRGAPFNERMASDVKAAIAETGIER